MQQPQRKRMRVPDSSGINDAQSAAKFLSKNPRLFDSDWDALFSSKAAEDQEELLKLGNLFWDIGMFATALTLSHWVTHEHKQRLMRWTSQIVEQECTCTSGTFQLVSAVGFVWFHIPVHWAKDDAIAEMLVTGGRSSILGFYSKILVKHLEVPIDDYFFNLITVTQLHVAYSCANRGVFSDATKAGVIVGAVALALKSELDNLDVYTAMAVDLCDAARSAPDDTANSLKVGSITRKAADAALDGKSWEDLTVSLKALKGLVQIAICVNGADKGAAECAHCGKKHANFLCMVCGTQRYCDLVCQQHAWNSHRRFCQRLDAKDGRTMAKTSTVLLSHFVDTNRAEIMSRLTEFVRETNIHRLKGGGGGGKEWKEEDIVVMVNLDDVLSGRRRPIDAIHLELRCNLLKDAGGPPWLGDASSKGTFSTSAERKRCRFWVSKLRDKNVPGEVVCLYLSPGSAFYSDDYSSCDFGVGVMNIGLPSRSKKSCTLDFQGSDY